MENYYPYDVFSTERIEETLTVEEGLIQLRHTPKYRSVVIDGFDETDSISLLRNQFRVDYSLDTYYRESNRLLHFNPENDGKELTISYITCGTPITADDMNEIKAHLDSDHSKYYQLPIATADIRGGFRVGQGLYMTGDILNVGSSIDGGGSFYYELPIASATQLGGIKIGDGLSISDGILSANGYILPTASASTKGGVIVGQGLSMTGDTLNADFTGLVLGEGLAFDDDGKLCVVKKINSDGWAYQDSGYDVIPAAPLIYVDDTHFYQPEINGTMNDMFNTPEGVMEFWMRGDIFISNSAVNGNVFRFGYFSAENNWFVSIGNGYSSADGLNDVKYNQLLYLVNSSPYTYGNGTRLYLTKNAENHFLFHAVSHPTDGYIEITLNYGTFRETGNVNGGKPFENLFVYSNSQNCLFSNFVVSSTQLEY